MAQHPSDWYLAEYDRLLEAFIDTFADLSKAIFNQPYAPGKWSPGQIVEHLTKSDASILRVLDKALATELANIEKRSWKGRCDSGMLLQAAIDSARGVSFVFAGIQPSCFWRANTRSR